MATGNTEPLDGEERTRDDETGLQTDAKRVLSAVADRDSNGMVSMLAGAVLLAWTARTARRSKGRAALMGLAGAALLKHGFGKRGSGDESPDDDLFARDAADEEKDVSDEAHAHRERSDVLGQSETNPRGTSGEPDVDTETDPEEGSIRFTEEQNEGPGSEPHRDEGPHDPRIDDDDEVEVDLSDAAMADEASEAVGPTSEQAQPASTEGTEPEPTPAEDTSHVQADVPDDSESGADGDEMGDDESEDDRTAERG